MSYIDVLYENPKRTSIILWLALWAATLYHAGLIVWAMLFTAQLPPGYEIPPNWTNLFGPGPTWASFWVYVVILSLNILWESTFKGLKTYVKPSFPFPDFHYSHIAMILWVTLNLFADLGDVNKWFIYPAKLAVTLLVCLILGLIQHLLIKAMRDPEGFKQEYFDESPKESTASQPKTQPNIQLKAQGEHPYPLSSDDEEITRKLLDYVHQNGQAKTGGLVGVLGSPRRTVVRTLNKLLADGRLVREGSGSGAVYRLNTSTKEDRFN